MFKHISSRVNAAFLRRFCAVILLACCALCLCACGNSNGGKPSPTELQPATEPPAAETNVDITEAQRERILQLAAAFRQFGEYGEGIDFAKMEHIVFCLYSDSDELEDCGIDGFGRLPVEKADAAIKGVFGDLSIMDVMRRKYDSDEEQTYYYKNGYYYLMRTDNSAYTYTLENVKRMTDENGREQHAAIVNVKRDGKNELDMIFTLMPNDDSIYRVSACDMSLWY